MDLFDRITVEPGKCGGKPCIRGMRITSSVEQTPYYDLKGDSHRFYLVDSFIPTDAKKTSPGGIFGLRYLDLSKILPAYNPRKNYTSEELAAALKEATWE